MKFRPVFAAALVLAATVAAQAQTVKVEFLMGKVNLTAQNASVRAIITEWGRVGGTRIVNPERLGGAPVTLQLTDVPERQALDILLRDVGGYMVGPRQTELVPGISAFDRLMVVTATAGPAPRPAPAGGFNGGNGFPRPSNIRRPPVAPVEPEVENEDQDEISEPEPDEPAQGAVPNRQGVRPAVMPALPQADPPVTPPAPAPTRGNPFGIQGGARPGTVTPVPAPSPAPRPPDD